MILSIECNWQVRLRDKEYIFIYKDVHILCLSCLWGESMLTTSTYNLLTVPEYTRIIPLIVL